MPCRNELFWPFRMGWKCEDVAYHPVPIQNIRTHRHMICFVCMLFSSSSSAVSPMSKGVLGSCQTPWSLLGSSASLNLGFRVRHTAYGLGLPFRLSSGPTFSSSKLGGMNDTSGLKSRKQWEFRASELRMFVDERCMYSLAVKGLASHARFAARGDHRHQEHRRHNHHHLDPHRHLPSTSSWTGRPGLHDI